jgi:hypothetical protein
MRNYRLLILVGISIATLLSSLLPAVADQTYNGASVYRDTDTIYKVGVTPNISVPVTPILVPPSLKLPIVMLAGCLKSV